jgi:hypothetical protein
MHTHTPTHTRTGIGRPLSRGWHHAFSGVGARRRAVRTTAAVLLAGPWTGTALTATPGVAAPGPDTPAPQTHCTAEAPQIAGQRIEGDLVVHADCEVERVLVTGDLVVVEPSATVWLRRSTVEGDVRTAGLVSTGSVTVYGGVRLEGSSARFYAYDTTVRRSVRGWGESVSVWRTRVDGAVNVTTTGEVALRTGSSVGGWVNTHGSPVIVLTSSVDRGLTATGADLVVMCDARVAGDVTITGLHGPAELGGPTTWSLNCPSGRTSDPVDIGGSLTLVDNPHSILVREVSVGGDLVCTGNTGPRGLHVLDVQVSGARVGQCA